MVDRDITRRLAGSGDMDFFAMTSVETAKKVGGLSKGWMGHNRSCRFWVCVAWIGTSP